MLLRNLKSAEPDIHGQSQTSRLLTPFQRCPAPTRGGLAPTWACRTFESLDRGFERIVGIEIANVANQHERFGLTGAPDLQVR